MNSGYVAYDTATGLITIRGDTAKKLKNGLDRARKHEALKNQQREERHRDYRYANSVIVSMEEYDREIRTTKTVRNLMSGAEIEIDINTPAACDPSTETYWSM